MRWHRLARLAAAAIGLAAVGLVVTKIGTRPARVAQTAPERLDPRATVESTGATTSEIRGVKEDYQVKAAHQLMYEDGTSRSLDVEITVKNRGGRDFVMSGKEARAGAGNASLDLTGRVNLRASDGFEIDTDAAHYSEADGLVRAPGTFTFRRGRMQGSGVGMVYDKGDDVLAMTSAARIIFLDEAGAVVTDVSGGSATLDRGLHILTIEGGAHAVRDEQALDASRLVATLSEDNEHVTFMELRGEARVAGGSAAFDSMSAAAIDLSYNSDGSILERVSLDGTAAVAMAGDTGGASGRQVFGDRLGITLEAGDTVTGLSGLGHVRLDLPATSESPLRSITAHELAGTGKAPQGLTDVRFSGSVVFRETPPVANAQSRTARSATLQLVLEKDAVGQAAFAGAVTFEEQGLRAGGGEADYDPSAGTLVLRGRDAAGAPRVEDARVSVIADQITVTLDSHHMTATGRVQTVLRQGSGEGGGQLPGLLDRSQAARATAGTFVYAGGNGQAVYTGSVQLWQGETTIRTDRLVLDRDTGDLDATGTARATLTLDSGTMVGRADRIHYADATRSVEYLGAQGSAAAAQLSGPQGDLRADRIALVLAAASQTLEYMDATGRTVLKLEGRTIAGARLHYRIADERYDIEGTPGTPVTITQGCDSTTGRALTWFKATDRMLVDGREDTRTSTKSRGGPCPESRPR
ncbi:MAG: LptA/OstA family protein [Vicinamibacterales bacterium]